MVSNCELSLFHWYPGSGVVLDLSIPGLCTLTYFVQKACGDLVYKFKRIVGKPNFSDQFKKIIKR